MRHIRPPEWLVRDFLPQGAYAILFGAPGTFKTFIALDIALSVACGSMARSERAPASLSPPREAKRRSSPRTRSFDASATCVPGLSTGVSSTSTRPARISACARVREVASPSATSR